ncbi:ComEA family DNA-binding protein [Salinisphaera sp. RV14]|uniref:ComEA family DNA-binding protein n=1 Tax=unclassified Salinisphaera TaxID=2649847 RepID=UPI003F87A888
MRKFIFAAIAGSLLYATTALAVVNVNTATVDQLQTLDGIGSVKAQAIVKDRQANGDYDSLGQLSRVNGIGAKTIESLRSEATVNDESASADTGS